MRADKAFQATPAIPAQVADHVQRLIVRGELSSGQRISEAELTELLGVSRGSVREAMQVLAARHLVTLLPRRGARVAELSAADVRGLYDVEGSLLTLLVQRAAEIWRDDDLAQFQGFVEQLENCIKSGDALEVLAMTGDFQVAVCDMVGNSYLKDTLLRLNPAFSRAHYRALTAAPGQAAGFLDFVRGVLAGVVARDKHGLAQVVEEYARAQCALVLATFDDAE